MTTEAKRTPKVETISELESTEEPQSLFMDSGLVRFAIQELRALNYDVDNMNLDKRIPARSEDDANEWMTRDILELLRVFSEQGHSGFSAAYCLSVFSKLAKFEPLTPLSGEDSEWNDVSDVGGGDGTPLWQNNRCSHVFKDGNGAYDIDGKVFVESDGSTYTNSESRVPVTFPYTPTTIYVKAPVTDLVNENLV